ncbi:site-specific DNA-methyltransferase [Paenibacillus sp. RS8]|uniref:site-specific DNA-methyltransferase n=1 Tax=Paenibacillus sp. RS8 TaxID=3242681 RepID=UPI0035BEDC92
MAHLEDVISEIQDPRLREKILSEVRKLKNEKKFGLVFEDHMPELIPLYNSQIKKGVRIAKKTESMDETYKVQSVADSMVNCLRESDNVLESLSIEEVVVVKRFGEPIYPTLVPVESIIRNSEKPHHILIEADNFHALQCLEYTHQGKVDCIYIDPPYNTGARDWKYNNNYVDNTDQWKHSKWLSFMQKRLLLAKRILRPDGVLIVTIDEHEIHNLGVLLEQIFPSHLRHTVTIVMNPKGTGKLNFARVDEYAIFCVPNLGESIIVGKPTKPFVKVDHLQAEEVSKDFGSNDDFEDELIEEDIFEDGDMDFVSDLPFPEEEIDLWELRHARRRGGESSYRHQRKNQFYALYLDPHSKKIVKAGESLLPLELQPTFEMVDGLVPIWPIDAEGNQRCWRFIPSKMQSLINERRVVLGRFNTVRQTWTVNIWERTPTTQKLKTVWWDSLHDAGTHGTTHLNNVLGRRDAFPFPKSVYAVKDCIAAVVRDRPNAIIVDFFAGSGSTLHAVSLLNMMDDGKRQCILITNNEVQDRQAKILKKQGLQPGDSNWEANGICQSVTFPRCKYILNGYRDDGTKLSGEMFTGRKIRVDVPRVFRPLSFTTSDQLIKLQAKKQLAAVIGITQSKIDNSPWYLQKDEEISVLFDMEKLEDYCKEVSQYGGHLTTIVLTLPNNKAFKLAKERIMASLPPLYKDIDEVQSLSDGLDENLDYVRLDFLDPTNVELGHEFSRILPLLWMMAGAIGPIPNVIGNEDYLFPKDCPFAVLINETAFPQFRKEIGLHQDLSYVFLVTDSNEAFLAMQEEINSPNVIQLYRNYLDNFRINTGEVRK